MASTVITARERVAARNRKLPWWRSSYIFYPFILLLLIKHYCGFSIPGYIFLKISTFLILLPPLGLHLKEFIISWAFPSSLFKIVHVYTNMHTPHTHTHTHTHTHMHFLWNFLFPILCFIFLPNTTHFHIKKLPLFILFIYPLESKIKTRNLFCSMLCI